MAEELDTVLKTLAEKKVSGRKFARFLGVPAMKVSNWKRGKHEAPKEFLVFCRVLQRLHDDGVDIADLLEKCADESYGGK